MEPVKLYDISPEKLNEIANAWEENSIAELVSSSVIELGKEIQEAKAWLLHLETKAQIRTMRLFHFHNFTKRQIADLFGVELRQVTKWLK
jgi:ribosomal protein L29